MEPIHYYAFIEAIDPFFASQVKQLEQVLKVRKSMGVRRPTHSIWIETIEALYFDNLNWTSDLCNPEIKGDRDSRIYQIKTLDTEKLKVIQAPLSRKEPGERNSINLLSTSGWYLIKYCEGIGESPCLISSDYEQGDVAQGYISDISEIGDKDTLLRLLNVFSLDHIADENFTDNETVDGRIRLPVDFNPPEKQLRELIEDSKYTALDNEQSEQAASTQLYMQDNME